MGKRRANNEGSIFQEASTGLWVAEISLPDGKRKRKRSKTQRVVKDWLLAQREALRDNTFIEDDRMTFDELSDKFMRDIGAITLRPKTIDSYQILLKLHIRPHIGQMQLSKIKPSHLQSLYTQKLESGLSKRTVQYIHAIIRRILNQAVKWDLLVRNPANSVEAPKPVKRPPETLSVGELQIFLDSVKAHPYYPIYCIALGCGLREGEILGLRKKDVNLLENYLAVEQTIVSINGYLSIGEPKSEASRRTVAMPDFVASTILKPWEKALSEDSLLFATSTGKPISPRNLLRHFHKSLEKLGIRKVKFHSLRHSFVSYLLSKNVPPKDVQAIAGHSSFSVTMDIYGHLMPNAQRDAARKIDGLFKV